MTGGSYMVINAIIEDLHYIHLKALTDNPYLPVYV
jgi:hypothetical protein